MSYLALYIEYFQCIYELINVFIGFVYREHPFNTVITFFYEDVQGSGLLWTDGTRSDRGLGGVGRGERG